ncbi:MULTISPECIES: DUF3016 domain-containing protein [Methylomonas]|nr:DUF3016 domain-containing protein [Methylomonas koyamae]
MPKLTLLAIAMLVMAQAACADISIRFENVEHYTDLALSGAATPRVQADLLQQFEAHFRKLAGQYLPAGDSLDLAVEDIDMAGAFEPWQTPNATNTRFIRDLYYPRIKLNYRWYGPDGQIKAEKQEQISDLNYLMLQDSARYPNNDPLRYEKAMLDRWFADSFGKR